MKVKICAKCHCNLLKRLFGLAKVNQLIDILTILASLDPGHA